jgi:hypothetical protein
VYDPGGSILNLNTKDGELCDDDSSNNDNVFHAADTNHSCNKTVSAAPPIDFNPLNTSNIIHPLLASHFDSDDSRNSKHDSIVGAARTFDNNDADSNNGNSYNDAASLVSTAHSFDTINAGIADSCHNNSNARNINTTNTTSNARNINADTTTSDSNSNSNIDAPSIVNARTIDANTEANSNSITSNARSSNVDTATGNSNSIRQSYAPAPPTSASLASQQLQHRRHQCQQQQQS